MIVFWLCRWTCHNIFLKFWSKRVVELAHVRKGEDRSWPLIQRYVNIWNQLGRQICHNFGQALLQCSGVLPMNPHIGQFVQFGLNVFNSNKHTSLSSSSSSRSWCARELKSSVQFNQCVLCTRLLELHEWAMTTRSVPKYSPNIDAN